MRRVALQAFRTARLSPLRKLGRGTQLSLLTSGCSLGARSVSWSRKAQIPASSMHVRRLSIAAVSAVIGTGAWYAYKDTKVASESRSSNAQQLRSFSRVAGADGRLMDAG